MGAKVCITIALLHKVQHTSPRHTLISTYKFFIRSYLDYGGILYDKAFNASFNPKIESIQYNACLAITGGYKGKLKRKRSSRAEFGITPTSTMVSKTMLLL